MKIILLENKNISMFPDEQQVELRQVLGVGPEWNGVVESEKKLKSIVQDCNGNLSTVMQLICSGLPGYITQPTLVLNKDDFLGAFTFKTRYDQKDIEAGLVIAIHNVYTSIGRAHEIIKYLRAMGIKLPSAHEYGCMEDSLHKAKCLLHVIEDTWPRRNDEHYPGTIRKLVTAVQNDPFFVKLSDNVKASSDVCMDEVGKMMEKVEVLRDTCLSMQRRLDALEQAANSSQKQGEAKIA